MKISRGTLALLNLKQLVISLAIIASLAVGGTLATPAAAAAAPSINANYNLGEGILTVDGQSFTPGGVVDITVTNSAGGRVASGTATAQPAAYWATCGGRYASRFGCHRYNPFAGDFSVTLSRWLPCDTLVVHARDRATGRSSQTTLVVYCLY